MSDLSKTVFAFKPQSGKGVPASGAAAFGIELLAGGGLQSEAASIVSAMMKHNRMKKRARRGPVKSTAAYETELVAEVFEGLGPAILGAAAWTAKVTVTEATLTSVTISGTGTILTFGGGSLLTAGLLAGMFVRFTDLSTSGNNGKWVPVLSVGGAGNRVATIPSGYLVDQVADIAFSMEIARHVLTPTNYVDSFHSVEEYIAGMDVPRSKFVSDARFNSLIFNEGPSAYPKISFGIAARTLELKAAGAGVPVMTSPVFPSGESLILLDGGVFLNGTKRLDLTALTFGITAPVSQTDVIGTTDGPAANIGDFEFAGQVTGLMEDGDDFDDYAADADLSLLCHYKDKQDESGIGVYAGNLAFGSFASPAAGTGDNTQTMKLYGGDDDRGAGYAPTTLLISDLTVA